jgi:phosphate-selective porin OprO/OprP
MTDPAQRWRAAALAAASMLPLASARAEPTVAELLQRLEDQEQKILVLERRLEIKEEADKAVVASSAVPKAGPRGFSIQSADAKNQIKLRGVLHFDGRYFADDVAPETADTWLLRRVRPTLEGTLGGIYDFRFTPDFAGGRSIILDAFATARLQPWANVTVGKFKVPVGLERLQSANDIRFVERAFPTGIVPNRDLGVSVGGDVFGGTVNYSFGYYNGASDGGSSDAIGDVENDSEGDWAARLYATPFANSDNFALRGLGFGIAGTYVDSTGDPVTTLLPQYRTPGQQVFFRYRGATTALPQGATYGDGERLRYTPQFYYAYGRFGLLGEYAEVSQDVTRRTASGVRSDSLDNSAWQLAAHWFLTGEEQAFRGFKPNTVFSLVDGTWGAFELVGRYQELSIDDAAFVGGADSFADPAVSARNASAWGLGINWYLSENLKWVLNYERTSFDGGAAGGADREDEEVFLTRIALGF